MQKGFLAKFLDLTNGIRSHDTIGRVFAALEPETLQEVFRQWISALAEVTKGEVGRDRRQDASAVVSRRWQQGVCSYGERVGDAQSRVLGQFKTEEKSNEITAIPRLLELLQIKGTTVTIDAMGCQKDIAAKIVEGDANYMLAVKDNQPTLHDDIQAAFAGNRRGDKHDFFQTKDNGHGRVEVRRCMTCHNLDSISRRGDWANLACLVMVEVDRTVDGKTSTEQRYYISSQQGLRARDALATVRAHWGIENGLHWVLDVAFREDDCRVRAGHAAENSAVLRHFTMNLLKNVKSKVGIKIRRQRAGWDNDFLLHVLCG